MIIDNTKNSTLYLGANKRFEKAFAFIEKAVKENLPAGKYEIDGKEVYASVLE
jgi:beta-galactosidase beta subunit